MMRCSGWPAAGILVAGWVLWAQPAGAADAAPGLSTAKTETIVAHVTAYAVVEPRAVLKLRAGVPGMLRDLTVQPGDAVAEAAVLGHLAGPEVDASLAARQAALATAEATLKAAQQQLDIQRAKAAGRLATRGDVDQAVAAVSKATAERDRAGAALSAAQDMASLRAPSAGRVLALDAASGERVQAGETILTLVPADDLRLRAAFYGADADRLRPGMPGRFVPAGGAAAIPVKLRAILGALRPDGARMVDMVAADAAPQWLDGQAGMVTVDTGAITGVAVPTAALILDQAQWWVLVHDGDRDTPQKVTLGPRRGGVTLIESGLAPGAAVVVANPYLRYHRGISGRYQPPD